MNQFIIVKYIVAKYK